MLILTFGEILAMPFMNAYWIGRTVQNNRGQYAALYSVAWASAQTVGPYAGSLVAEHSGYKMLWFIIGAICFLLGYFLQEAAACTCFICLKNPGKKTACMPYRY